MQRYANVKPLLGKCENKCLLLGANGLLLRASVLLAASLEAIGTDLEETGARAASTIRASLDLECLGGLVGAGLVVGAPGVTAGVALAAAAEAVGAGLEEAGSGRADGGVIGALGDGVGADGSGTGAGIRLAASTETVGARLEETSSGRADGRVVRSLGVIGADTSVASASIRSAAAAEAIRADLEETGTRSTLSIRERNRSSLSGGLRLGLGGLGLVVGADASGTGASVRLAAASEAVGTRLEETGTGGADSRVISALDLLVIRADSVLASTGVRLAASLEAVGADLEEASARSTLAFGKRSRSSLRLPVLSLLGLGLGTLNRLGDEDRIASTLDEISAPLYGTRINGAITAEAIVRTSVELANA